MKDKLMTQHKDDLRRVVDALIAATNAFNLDAALAMFTPDALIDDPSTGQRFEGHIGIRNYIEQYFVGYHTVTRVLAIEFVRDGQALVRVDFTGDFGHEIGRLEISVDHHGLITLLNADLE